MENRTGVILTGGDFQGLGVLRTLGEKGIPIVLIDHEHCIGKYSKYSKKFFKAPRPYDEKEYIEFLLALIDREGLNGWVIIPNSDQIVYVLSKYKDELEKKIHVPTPGLEVINFINSKSNTYHLAEENGIDIPKTYFVNSMVDLLNQSPEFPLVLKPAIKEKFYSKVKIKAFKVENLEQLKDTYEYMSTVIDPSEIVIQEFLSCGTEHLYSVCPFFKNGKIITSITARRARQHPMDFGHASTFAEIVDIPELLIPAQKFLSLINYYGLCEVEFMYDEKKNVFKLIEVNPRPWGWHTLAIAAGIDLPFILYSDVIGEGFTTPDKIKNAKWVRLLTDTPTVITEIFKGKMKVKEYLNSMKGEKEFAVFSMKDPAPFFFELILLPYLWVKRGF